MLKTYMARRIAGVFQSTRVNWAAVWSLKSDLNTLLETQVSLRHSRPS
jgi:hypothetical protein